MMRRMTQKFLPEVCESIAVIEPLSAESLRPKNERVPVSSGSDVCGDCRHRHCQVCKESSAAKQFSDFWICHRCGELNRRVCNSDLKGVPDEFGKD
jgi:hypothetical protein